MNRQELEFKKSLQEEIPIPDIVNEKAHEAFMSIQRGDTMKNNNINMDKKRDNSRVLRIRKVLIGAGTAAAAAGCFLLWGMSEPVLASQIPVVGHIFEMLQENYSYPGDYSDKAVKLETEPQTAQGDSAQDKTEQALDDTKDAAKPVYSKTSDGVTITLSELYCDDMAMYLTLNLTSEEVFPISEIMKDQTGNPAMQIELTENYSFKEEVSSELNQIEGKFIDEHTYAGIVRINYQEAAKMVTEEQLQEYNQKYQAAVAAGKNPEEENINLEVKKLDIPDNFKLKMTVNKIVAYKENPESWESGYTTEEMENMSDEEWMNVMKQVPEEYTKFPNNHENIWWEGEWGFDLDVNIDRSQTQKFEINTSNEEGKGIESVVVTPFELVVNQIDPNNSSSKFPVVLDANGKMLPYGSDGSVDNYAINNVDISTLYLYLCNEIEYMDEIKGFKNDDNFKSILDERAVYKEVLHTGIQN